MFFYPLEDIVTLNLYASNNIAFKIYIAKDDRTKSRQIHNHSS